LKYEYMVSGGDFIIDVKHKAPDSEVIISVEGWVKYTAFPLSQCSPSSFDPKHPGGEAPEYVMHVHTYDRPKSIKLHRLYPSGIAHHLVYHRCAMNVSRYEVIVQPEDLPRYLKNPHLLKFAKLGWLTFVLKAHHPARMNLPFIYNYHQVLVLSYPNLSSVVLFSYRL
jgi:hypothetical protein